jgi:maltose alpha-D-glucosyltransferase/alpha-amylase
VNGSIEPWYRTAVLYEVAVHSFQDSNGDGFGDIGGLTERLDYLQWLGITAIWMLPILPSRMKDGGYDVTNLTGIRSEYGSLDDVRNLIREAHRRGIKVITDFVVNHTSDQHPWFVEAKQPGSAKRDWYVWSDTAERYSDARVIFVDTHDTNWAWDETAGQFYWHRFFDHQPDLNFENLDVQEAIIDAILFWLDLGFDGLRLDAVPYLFEEDGTDCENLPATHSYLKRIRSAVEGRHPDAVLLAEANQWPRDLLPYFGEGDECHMAYHFPVMPRLFLALATGDTTPIAETLEQTPELPASAQWAVFLRNHDELTLEMVTEVERDVLNTTYAPDPKMRKNIGIRRRLSPLLGADRRKIELLNAVLMSLPGSPVIYYGDEIGMGDNVDLSDRDGLRTPMQWEATPSAGWSAADPNRFYQPVIEDSVHGPDAVNVADQQADGESLLNWMRNLISARPATMGTAPFELMNTDDPGVLGYIRGGITVLANFTDEFRSVNCSCDEAVKGSATIEGGIVTLQPYGWVWLATLGSLG